MQAHRPFTITFDNQDAGVAHNVAIHTGYWMYSVAAPWLFAGEYITGTATTVYHVPGLAPGRYVFMCDVHHDQMTGHFLVVQGGPRHPVSGDMSLGPPRKAR